MDKDQKPMPESRSTRVPMQRRLTLTLDIPRPEVPTSPLCSNHFPQFTSALPVALLTNSRGGVGAGAFGTVVQATMMGDERVLAIKKVKVTSDDVLRLCVHEFEVLRRLTHPNIIRVFRLLLEEETITSNLFMEFIPGRSLKTLVHEKYAFSEREVQSLARQLFSTLSYMQSRGLVHRDIHPGNILLNGGVLTLIDFQTACGLGECCGLVGTNPYQAPEMWIGQTYDCRVDVWSAGTVLARLLKDILPGRYVSEDCRDFLAACTATDPRLRVSASEALQLPWLQ